MSLLGWVLDVPRLTDWFGNGLSTQPNTAVGVAGAGLALVLLALGWRRTGAVLGLLVAALGTATLFQWISGTGLGIDTLLTFDRPWGRGGLAYVGRMGIPGSISLTLLGVALVLSGLAPRHLRRRVPLMALATFGLGVLSITGYLYGADVLFTVPRATAIAMQTAWFVVTLSMGVIALHPEHRPMRWLISPSAVGVVARRAVPAVVVAPILLGWITLMGERARFYDTSFGTSLLVLALIALLGVILWRGLQVLAKHESDLLASEERVQLAIAAGDAGTWDLDLRTGDNNRSDSYFRMLGYDPVMAHLPPQELWESVVWREDLPQVRKEWLRALAARELFRQEYRARRADGSIVWVRAAGRFFYDDLGRAVRFVGVFVDVTESHYAIEALREADRRKDEFLATLAHELRNPLAPVRNALGVLKLKGPATTEVQWARDVIDRQMQQMTRLIDDLLDTSRIGTGKIALQRERIEFAEALNGAIESSRPLIAQFGHELHVDLPPGPLWVHGDLVRLSQVFCNLLNNAARYTPHGGRIEVVAHRSESAIAVTVRDNGIGIPREMLPKVFDMFTQVDRSLERSRGGLGIGLTLVRQLVELHGGCVEAHSAGPGLGSEFVVRLPLLADAGGRMPAGRGPAPTVAGGRRVLVVDDNEDAAESLAMLLRLMGMQCRTAHDGLEGVRLAREEQPDVVLLDIGLPGMNGYDAAKAIRAEPWAARTKVIAMTGWGQDDDRRRSRAAGFDAHLVKPVAMEQLVEVLATAPASETATAAAS
ncbi:MAG TPA: ATP-binding protein [Steroidobacteraceae bacterium]|nr:ATP-binding protein [Steroidobacteraceae bacterium]